MTSVEMKPLNVSSEQETIRILSQSLDEINNRLKDGEAAYKFMKTQTSKAPGDKNKKAHQEDLQNMKKTMDGLKKVRKEIQDEIKKLQEKKKKGGRKSRKKRGRKSRKKKRKSKRNKRRTRRAGTLKQSKIPGQRGLTKHEIKLRAKSRINKVSKNLREKLLNDNFSKLSISRERSPSPPGFDAFMKTHVSPPTTPLTGGKKTRKKRRRKRRR